VKQHKNHELTIDRSSLHIATVS